MARLHVTIYAESASLDRVLEYVSTRTLPINLDEDPGWALTELAAMADKAIVELGAVVVDIDRRRRSTTERTT